MICIPIVAAKNDDALLEIKRACLSADFIELRMDLIRDGNLAQLIPAVRSFANGVRIIVTCRRQEEALTAITEEPSRQKTMNIAANKMKLLKQAIELNADFIDVELAEGQTIIAKLRSFCRKQKSSTQLIVSYHDIRKTPSGVKLKNIFNSCVKSKADVVKIVTLARVAEDNLKVIALIPYALKHKKNIIAFCMGEKGRISRVAAPFLGSYLGFATLGSGVQSAPGQLTVREMRQLSTLIGGRQSLAEGWPLGWPVENPENYVLLGKPVQQSLSPLMHNAALKMMGVNGNYSAYCVDDLARALESMKGMNIRGASVTIPYKVAVMEYLDEISPDAINAGAVNTIVNNHGRLIGYNTDWLGLMLTIKKVMPIKNKTFLVIGAGGTARAAVYGLMKEGGYPMILNRTMEKSKILAGKFNCPYHAIADLPRLKADCLINTTSVGMYPRIDQSPVDATALSGYQYVVDVIYNPLKTKLLHDAEKAGCRIISGLDMFVHQGAEQIKLWTGKEPHLALMKKVVLERLDKN